MPLTTGEVNSLLLDLFLPVVKPERGIMVGWTASGVQVHADGRLFMEIPHDDARRAAEIYAADHPEVLNRIRQDWRDEMRHDSYYDGWEQAA